MKILWVCNIMLPAIARQLQENYSVREGWLTGILNRLLEEETKGLELGICFPVKADKAGSWRLSLGPKNKRVACYGFAEDLEHPECYDAGLESVFAEILTEFQPDLVHLFGTEFGHAYACARAFGRPERTLVGIQGVCSAIAEGYMADLPQRIVNSRTLRDVLKKDSLLQQQEKFTARGRREQALLKLVGHVGGRTAFDRAFAARVNPGAVYHAMDETMRDCFYQDSWRLESCKRHLIFASQADYPLKGFHYLLEAMPEILEKAPDAKILVAGNSILGMTGLKSYLKLPAYGKYLRSLLIRYGLQDRVQVLGMLSAEEMKRIYQTAHVFVCPSAVENSPNSVAEAQLLGTPVVASNAAGIPSMVEDQVGGLLFQKGDPHALAEAVLRIFDQDEFACRLSEQERQIAARRYDGGRNYRRLLEIYGEIMA